MKPSELFAAALAISSLAIATFSWSDDAKPSNPVITSDGSAVEWRFHADLEDGRNFITDGAMLIESKYLPNAAIPEKSIPAQTIQRLLDSPSERQFGLENLEQKGGHYVIPGLVQINRKYVEALQSSPMKSALRFCAKGPNDPIVILDGQKAVGVVMPMKAAG